MSATQPTSPALAAAQAADEQVLQCLVENKSFLLEAGAGAGKTYSLIEVLRYLIEKRGSTLRRHNQKIACITYTNVATAVINSRIDGNPLVLTDTIHAFCWSLIRNFQPFLRQGVTGLEAWQERLQEAGPIGSRRIEYDLGHRRITDEFISIHHDDVLALMIGLLPLEKFKRYVAGKYPFILIDEYQDTNLGVMDAIKAHLLGRAEGPVIGLFGDHWQRIYDKTCGWVDHPSLTEIGKGSNFRSCTAVVNVLNAMRPELPQAVKDENFIGSAVVYHTNSWNGTRRPGTGGGHWKGDLPADVAHAYLESFIAKLTGEGWDFGPGKTKVLMLTHNVLASEQGYASLSRIFPYTDLFLKKEDEYISFFADKLEPACEAFSRRRYGEMFSVLGDSAQRFVLHSEKMRCHDVMQELIGLRAAGSIGDVIDYIRERGYPLLPDAIQRREDASRTWQGEEGEEPPENVRRCRELRKISYQEVTFDAAVPILSQLLKAEMAEREVRSISYQIKAARFPAYKDLTGFDFAASEANEALIRQLHRGEFMDGADNIVLIGGPGTGKSHVATALGVQAVEHHRKKVRFFATVDPVNALEQEKPLNKAG